MIAKKFVWRGVKWTKPQLVIKGGNGYFINAIMLVEVHGVFVGYK
jgi:hypothetical protein